MGFVVRKNAATRSNAGRALQRTRDKRANHGGCRRWPTACLTGLWRNVHSNQQAVHVMHLERWCRRIPCRAGIAVVRMDNRCVSRCVIVFSQSAMVMDVPLRVGKEVGVIAAVVDGALVGVLVTGACSQMVAITRMRGYRARRLRVRGHTDDGNVEVQASASALHRHGHAVQTQAQHQQKQPEPPHRPKRPARKIRLQVAKAGWQEHAAGAGSDSIARKRDRGRTRNRALQMQPRPATLPEGAEPVHVPRASNRSRTRLQ